MRWKATLSRLACKLKQVSQARRDIAKGVPWQTVDGIFLSDRLDYRNGHYELH